MAVPIGIHPFCDFRLEGLIVESHFQSLFNGLAVIARIQDVTGPFTPLLPAADIHGRHTQARGFVDPTAGVPDERRGIPHQIDEPFRRETAHDGNTALFDVLDDLLCAGIVIRIDKHALDPHLLHGSQGLLNLLSRLHDFRRDRMLQDDDIGLFRIEPMRRQHLGLGDDGRVQHHIQ